MRYIILIAVLTGACASPPSGPESKASLRDLAWLAGTWRSTGSGDGELLEEWWSPPSGDNMVGVFRWLKKGKGWVYEYVTIEDTGDGPVFHLRHFGPGAIAWEDKSEPFRYPLLRRGRHEVVFENPSRTKPRRFVYRLATDGALEVNVEGFGDDGKPYVWPFRFERQ